MSILTIGIGPAGFYRDRLPEILTKLQTQARGIYGEDIDIESHTPDGQLLGSFAECLDDIGQAIEDTYNGRNPNAATGQNLTSTCALNGVYRVVGDYSYVDVSVVVASGATVPSGTQVQDEDNGAVYAFSTAVVGNGEAQNVTCNAVKKGTHSAAGNVTKIVQPTYGLISVTNPAESSTVSGEETDENLAIRRNLSTAAPTSGFLESIYAGLLEIPGIGKVKVYENDTGIQKDIHPGDQALNPHSVTTVVTAGSASSIGAVLYNRKTPGVTTCGSTSVVVSDSLGIPHTMKYTLAEEVQIYVRVRYKDRPGSGFGGSGGEEAIRTALVTWMQVNQLPSVPVFRGFLWAQAQLAVQGLDNLPAVIIEDISIGTTEEGVVSADFIAAWDEYCVLTPENVVFQVVT